MKKYLCRIGNIQYFLPKAIKVSLFVLIGCVSCVCYGVKIKTETDVKSGIRSDDSLNDMFPVISMKNLPEGRVSASLTDCAPDRIKPGKIINNSVVLQHGKGPVYITFDLAPYGEDFKKLQLDSLSLWVIGRNNNWSGHPGNFIGRLSVSKDGKKFIPIPKSDVKLIAPQAKRLNHIRWKFKNGEVKGFRFLRIESFGFKKQSVRIAEIDGDISGMKVTKSTKIATKFGPISSSKISVFPPKISQTTPESMQVKSIMLRGSKLILKANGKSILDLSKLFKPESKNWRVLLNKHNNQFIHCVMQRKDGLKRTINADIDKSGKLVVSCMIKAPDHPVDYMTTTFDFLEGQVKYDGLVYPTPVFFAGRKAKRGEIGSYCPYLTYTSDKDKLELQFFIPDWYNIPGKMYSFDKGSLSKWELFTATQNTKKQLEASKLNGRIWHPISRKLKPGEIISYTMNIAAFRKSTIRTLGQIDIEDHPVMRPYSWIFTNEPGQRAFGSPTVLNREKMLFMGFKLPEPQTEKPGHCMTEIETGLLEPGMLNRLEKAGFGIVVLMNSNYTDVSHGIGAGDYTKIWKRLPELLNKLEQKDMKITCWFSPRGFLNRKDGFRQRDPLVKKHPDWFTKHTHWGGLYQTVDVFNPGASEWIIKKMIQDMTKYPQVNGMAFDSFPRRGVLQGPDGTTLVAEEQKWLRRFSKTIHDVRPGTICMANGCSPIYDDYMSYDYTVSENQLLMFLNELTSGHVPFGRPYVTFQQWRQLYHWWVTLSMMHRNFCDYDQGLGWFHIWWLGWTQKQIKVAYKNVDEEVVPLWYIMGKGRRIYAAEIAKDVRQIEARMPDGSLTVIASSINPFPQNLQIVPQNLTSGKYDIDVTVDTCKEHKDYTIKAFDTISTPGMEIKGLPPFSITVLKFKKAGSK